MAPTFPSASASSRWWRLPRPPPRPRGRWKCTCECLSATRYKTGGRGVLNCVRLVVTTRMQCPPSAPYCMTATKRMSCRAKKGPRSPAREPTDRRRQYSKSVQCQVPAKASAPTTRTRARTSEGIKPPVPCSYRVTAWMTGAT